MPSDPIAQVAEPFPPGQRPVNVAAWPCGEAASVTDTPDTEPSWTETWTVNDAACPRLIPDCDACTLTHSSACGADADADELAGSASHCEPVAASADPRQAARQAPRRATNADQARGQRSSRPHAHRYHPLSVLHGYSCAYSPASASTSRTYQVAWL